MSYLKALNLGCEPFSNTPDPEFFYKTIQHYGCLQKLEISIRLRRGLCVVVGEVGSGKTTLCRQMLRLLARDAEIDTHLIMDPSFESPTHFLNHVAEMLLGSRPTPGTSDWQIKEDIKQHLFQQGVEKGRTVVILIDEGQKIPKYGLEILREFLNYETNESKLVQIIIFAQLEFEKLIRELPNFADRISLFHQLKPLSFWDTQAMIQHRLDKARMTPQPLNLFSWPALWAIYRRSGGYPRKIVNLCHLCILGIIIEKQAKVDYFMVRSCAQGTGVRHRPKWHRPLAMTSFAALTLALFIVIIGPATLTSWIPEDPLKGIKSFFSAVTINAPVVQTSYRETVQPPSAMDKIGPPPSKPIMAPEKVNPPALAISEPPIINVEAKVQETTHPVASVETGRQEKTKAPDSPPEILGTVTIQPKETVTFLIQKVYGGVRMSYVDKILQVNPQITDLENVFAGQVLKFPAVPKKVVPHPGHLWGIEIGRKKDLTEAMKIIRSYSTEGPPIRIISSWNRKDGLKFQVIMRETYSDEPSARGGISQLPTDIQAKSKPILLWTDETVYFSDPFALVQTKMAEW
ncbi:MAG: AAA family ATPase [Deltaproteobacteria bacterium]|nr:AAA family ATPase [Deltaproteobacteria bacterium]